MADLTSEIQSYIDYVYDLLPKLVVPLDANPLEYSPKRISSHIVEYRRCTDRLTKVSAQLSEYARSVKKELRDEETGYEILKAGMMVSDPSVRAGRTQAERDAIVLLKHQDRYKRLQELRSQLEELQAIEILVKAKLTDLKDVSARIRDQIGLVDKELALGNQWRKRDETTVPTPLPSGPDVESYATRNQRLLGEMPSKQDVLKELRALVDKESLGFVEEADGEVIDVPPTHENTSKPAPLRDLHALYDPDAIEPDALTDILEARAPEAPAATTQEPEQDSEEGLTVYGQDTTAWIHKDAVKAPVAPAPAIDPSSIPDLLAGIDANIDAVLSTTTTTTTTAPPDPTLSQAKQAVWGLLDD